MPKLFDFRLRRLSETIRSVNFIPSYHSFRTGPLLSISLLAACFLAACTPTVNLATPDPVKVDIAVRLDVYQKTAPTKVKDEQSSLESGDIQQLKNNGIVGEDRDGYLDLRKPPSDPKYLQYAQGIISAENADRAYLYLSNAQAQNKPLEMVESDYAQLWNDRAFPGEWIQKENGSWIQK
jgi:uncharacterized protein YdbL (DUF1318 family)